MSHLLCSLLLLPPAAWGLLVALGARWDLSPANRGQQPVFVDADELRFVLGAAVFASGSIALLVLARIALALVGLCFPSRLRRVRRSWLVPLAAFAAAASNPVVCLLLPPEDPYTGAGFPGAALLGALFTGIIGAGFALPGIALFLYERSERVAPGSDAPVVSARPRTNNAWDEQGFRFSFYAADGHEPPHVHVTKGGAEAKWWLDPVAEAYSRGFNGADRSRIGRIVEDYREFLLGEWGRFFRGA